MLYDDILYSPIPEKKMSTSEQFNKPSTRKRVKKPPLDLDAVLPSLTPTPIPIDNQPDIPNKPYMIYTDLPSWADPTSPDYNPVKFLAEWSKGPYQFIASTAPPESEQKPMNWFQKILLMLGLGDSANKVKIEQIRSAERIKIKELEMAASITQDCKLGNHLCDDWKFLETISVWGNASGKYPTRYDRVYIGTCKHCKAPTMRKLSS